MMQQTRMTFSQGVIAGFRKLAVLDGRSRRMELASYGIVVTAVCLAVAVLLPTTSLKLGTLIVYALLMFSVLWRRFQDVGREGYNVAILYLLLYGLTADFGFEGENYFKLAMTGIAGVLLFLLMKDCKEPRNKYGLSPKYTE